MAHQIYSFPEKELRQELIIITPYASFFLSHQLSCIVNAPQKLKPPITFESAHHLTMSAPASTPTTTLGDIMRRPDYPDMLRAQQMLVYWVEDMFNVHVRDEYNRRVAGTTNPEQDVV